MQDPGTGHLNRTTTLHYDALGRVTQSIDPAGQETDFTYNSLGQPLSVQSYDSSHILQETITYTYDANGRTTASRTTGARRLSPTRLAATAFPASPTR